MEEGSAVIFTSSVAAFLPQPGFATYAASKAFILSFGRALAEELRPSSHRRNGDMSKSDVDRVLHVGGEGETSLFL